MSLNSNLLAHLQKDVTTIAYGLKLTRKDGNTYGFTSIDKDIVINGVTFTSSNGIEVSSLVSTSGFAVGNMEIRTLNDQSVYTEKDVINGLWDGCKYEILMFDYTNAQNTYSIITTGVLGEITYSGEMLTIELRDLRAYLQQPIGSASSKNCRAKFGSMSRETGGLCRYDLSASTLTGSVTSVQSHNSFTFPDLGEASQLGLFNTGDFNAVLHWGNGLVKFITGDNAGAEFQIADCTADRRVTLVKTPYNAIQAGDTFEITPGCNGTFSMCSTYWRNHLNFQGEPHKPNMDEVLSWTKTI